MRYVVGTGGQNNPRRRLEHTMNATYTIVSFGNIGNAARTAFRSPESAARKASAVRAQYPNATVRVVEVPAGRRAVDCDISDATLRVVG